MSKEVRAWIYGILVALGPVVAFYGFATQEEIALWLGVGGTILAGPAGTLALKNLTPSGEKSLPKHAATKGSEEPSEV